MFIRYIAALVLSAGIAVALTVTPRAEATELQNFSQNAYRVVPASDEAQIDQPTKRWTPWSAARRTTDKVAATARKIGRRIGSAVSGLFEAEEAPAPKATRRTAAAVSSDPKLSRLAAREATPEKRPSVSCEKAKNSIANYAFSDVKTVSCEGNIYEFAAERDGKRFAVKVSAASGDLLEVEKLEPYRPPPTESRAP